MFKRSRGRHAAKTSWLLQVLPHGLMEDLLATVLRASVVL